MSYEATCIPSLISSSLSIMTDDVYVMFDHLFLIFVFWQKQNDLLKSSYSKHFYSSHYFSNMRTFFMLQTFSLFPPCCSIHCITLLRIPFFINRIQDVCSEQEKNLLPSYYIKTELFMQRIYSSFPFEIIIAISQADFCAFSYHNSKMYIHIDHIYQCAHNNELLD